MAEFDQSSDLTLAHVIPPAVYTATEVGGIIDTRGYESVTFAIHIGVAINGSFTALIEEGDVANLSDATVLPAANRIGDLPTLAIADANKVFRVGSTGKKRYVRLTLTEGSANTAGVVGALAILGNPKSTPTDAQNT